MKPLGETENIHRFASPQARGASIPSISGDMVLNDIFWNHIYIQKNKKPPTLLWLGRKGPKPLCLVLIQAIFKNATLRV